MDAQIRALAEPHRRRILELIKDREMAAGEIAARFDVSRPAISQHLSVLRQARLISERRSGTSRLYRARPDGLAELKGFIDTFWAAGLDRLKDAAETEASAAAGEES
ncbi:MAG: metalloregulator ArsR/SmtB family transcription factor [Sporichthyaceae bacterium]|nr:metalloregulator ArsR/SmtB family transcription factor [Sporichthyaceae bacterium]